MFDFANMTAPIIVGQFIGFAAMGASICSFQAKNRAGILVFQFLSSLCWLTHFFLIGSMSGAVLNGVSVVRNAVYTFKKDYTGWQKYGVPAIIALGYGAAFIITFESAISIFPLLACLLATVALYMKDERVIRALSLLVSALWIVFDAAHGSIAGVAAEAFTICSILLALIRYRRSYLKK